MLILTKKNNNLESMLSEERMKAENYLEKALRHEREAKSYLSTIASMKTDIDELQGKLKDIQLLETMFCELKSKYAILQTDHSASLVGSDKQKDTKNEEINRLGNRVEDVITQ